MVVQEAGAGDPPAAQQRLQVLDFRGNTSLGIE
jgi:hypothetical protein